MLFEALPAAADERPPLGPLTAKHAAAFEGWLPTAPRDHFVIQLMTRDISRAGEIEHFLEAASRSLDPDSLRVHRWEQTGRNRIGVLYGEYPSLKTAWAALQRLPDEIRLLRPFPQQVNKLQQR